MAVAEYSVRLLDSSAGRTKAFFDSWRGLQYSHRVNGTGWYQFVNEDYTEQSSFFQLNDNFRIYRTIPGKREWYCEFDGLHRTLVRQTFQNGNRQFTSDGRGLLDLCGGRIVAYKTTTPGAKKAGAAETVIKDYVRENAGVNALSSLGRLRDGFIDGFVVTSDTEAGTQWAGDRSYENLLDTIQRIGNEASIDFDVRRTGVTSYEFFTKEGQLGVDRSERGVGDIPGFPSFNKFGQKPLVFSLENGNVLDPALSDARTDEVNVVYMLGRGEKRRRRVVTVADEDDIDDGPGRTNIREMSRSAASGENTTDELESAGREWLAERGKKETLSFRVIQVPGYLYGVDYFVGDIVTTRYLNVTLHKKIVAVTVNVSSDTGGESVALEFGDVNTNVNITAEVF